MVFRDSNTHSSISMDLKQNHQIRGTGTVGWHRKAMEGHSKQQTENRWKQEILNFRFIKEAANLNTEH